MEKLFEVAKPGAVFGEPVTAKDHTVITASEVTVGMGFGFGSGGGVGPQPAKDKAASEGELQEEREDVGGIGGGGGGGGGASGRPIAVITIGKDGVRVEPVVDATKIALAFFTMLGSIFLMASKIRQAAK